MKNKVFNTTFENILRILVPMSVLVKPVNSDRLTALDFICIYGKKCKVLDKNLHEDNEDGIQGATMKNGLYQYFINHKGNG